MEKDFDKTEKKTTDDDDEEKSNTKNTSKKSEKHEKTENDDNTKKPVSLASFFADKSDSKVSEEKSNDNEPNIHEDESTSNEDLTEDEVQEVVQIIIDEREQSVANELTATADGSNEELEAVAAGLFLESLRHESLNQNEITPESIELAYQDSLDDLLINTDTIDVEDANVSEVESSVVSVGTTNINPNSTSESVPINNNQATLTPLVLLQSMNTVGPIGPSNNDPQYNALTLPNQQNSNQNRSNKNFIPVPVPLPIDSGSALLAGTITGYIIGRRSKKSSGNINISTPTSKKLENQVQQLQVALYEKESVLRAVARKSSENSIDNTYKPLIIAERRKKRIELREELKRREELVNNPKVEKIGNFSLPALKIYRERRLPDGTENTPKRKPVEIMTVQELLEKSGHVKYEKWTIEELYKAHRITEKILRQITKEYMRDGPYKQTLSREVLPDPKIIAEKYSLVDAVHQNSEIKKNDARVLVDGDKVLNQGTQANVSQVNKNTEKNNLQKENPLPLPWITAVTAIGTLIALALIYIL